MFAKPPLLRRKLSDFRFSDYPSGMLYHGHDRHDQETGHRTTWLSYGSHIMGGSWANRNTQAANATAYMPNSPSRTPSGAQRVVGRACKSLNDVPVVRTAISEWHYPIMDGVVITGIFPPAWCSRCTEFAYASPADHATLCGGGTAQKNSDFQGTGFRSGTDPPCVRLIKYKGRRCYRRYISAWCFYTRETMSPSPSLWRILSRPSTAIWRPRSRHFPTMRGLRLAVSDVVILSSRSKERSGLETNRPSTCRDLHYTVTPLNHVVGMDRG